MKRPICLIFYLANDPPPAWLIEAMAPVMLVRVEAGSAPVVVTYRNGSVSVIVDAAQIDEARRTCPRGEANDLLMLGALWLAGRLTVGRSVLLWRST